MSKYIGWIPNLIGNISYTLVGRSKYPNKPDYCIFEYEDTFYYLITQRRISHDIQRKPKISTQWSKQQTLINEADFLLNEKEITSKWDAVLIGRCKSESTNDKNHQTLNGIVFFVPANEKNDIVSTIKSIDLESRNNKTKAIICEENLKAAIATESKLSCEFELYRNGFCYLSKLSPNLSNDPSDQFNLTENQAYDQCFFFLKDVFHTHKFHRPEYDTLTKTYPFDENAEWSWAKETLKVFYRTAIRTEPEDAIGIIYYARALKGIVKNKNLNDDTPPIKDKFSFLDEQILSDEYAEDAYKARVDLKKRLLERRKWQAGLISTAIGLAWTKSSPELLKDITYPFAINLIVYTTIAWAVLWHVEEISLSDKWQMIKFSNYLLSIDKRKQLNILIKIGGLGLILIIGIIAFLLLL